MSEPAARFRQPIDLDEFERRLRAGSSSRAAEPTEDPLAELARLVGHDDPFRRAPVMPQLRPAAERSVRTPIPHLQQVHPPIAYEPTFAAEPEAPTNAPELGAAGGAFDDHFDNSHAPELRTVVRYDAAEPEAPVAVHAAEEFGDDQAHETSVDADFTAFVEQGVLPSASVIAATEVPRRSWRGVIILSTILATGFAGLAAALTMRGHAPVMAMSDGGKALPMIFAGGPTKVQPPVAAADAVAAPPSVLDKTASTKPTKTKLVNTFEGPVDLSQQPRAAHSDPAAPPVIAAAPPAAATPAPQVAKIAATPPPARPPAAAATPDPEPAATAAAPAPAVKPPVVASLEPAVANSPNGADKAASDNPVSSSTQVDGRTAQSRGAGGFPEPKRVKVISVRPDGSIIGDDQDQAATPVPLGVAMPRGADAAPVAPAPAPSAALPQTADAGPAAAPPVVADPAPAEQAGKLRPGHDAVAALMATDGSKDPPRSKAIETREATAASPAPDPISTPVVKSRHGKKAPKVASLGNDDKASPAEARDGGGFAAQLAAAPSESAARATMRKLQKKYGGKFGGHRLSYHRVKVDGKTVYRVRVSNLSKDDATSLCSKLESGGGCFVARN